MARGDPFFARVDCNWFMGGKTSQLTPAERDTYINGLWLLAVEQRRERLPSGLSSGTRLAWRLHVCPKTARRHLGKLSRLGLITIHDNGDITVHGVRDCHPKLKWKDSPYPPHTGKPDFPIRGTNYTYTNTHTTRPYQDSNPARAREARPHGPLGSPDEILAAAGVKPARPSGDEKNSRFGKSGKEPPHDPDV